MANSKEINAMKDFSGQDTARTGPPVGLTGQIWGPEVYLRVSRAGAGGLLNFVFVAGGSGCKQGPWGTSMMRSIVFISETRNGTHVQ